MMNQAEVSARRPPAGVLAPGTILGRYEILHLISVGGMAEIYLARAEGIAGFEKKVVIKRLLPHLAVQPSFVDMFLAEARLAATLDHPNIVSVHDIGETTGDYYYTMEYVAGVDLREIVQAERRAARLPPIPIVVAIGRGLSAGLEHSHVQKGSDGQPLGVVHRDVSLSNVLVSYDGAVKVTDFGVAKVSAASNKTRVGTLKGKYGYMSPEQCRGDVLDRRSDVFAIGIVLWEMLAGRRLFAGEGEFAILKKIVDGIVDRPSLYRHDIPPQLEAIVLRALRREPGERQQTARELQRDLESWARVERIHLSKKELGEYMAELFPVEQRQSIVSAGAWSTRGGDGDFSVEVEILDGPGAPANTQIQASGVNARTAPIESRLVGKPLRVVALGGLVLSMAVALGFWTGGAQKSPGRVVADHQPLPAASALPMPAAPAPSQEAVAPSPAPLPVENPADAAPAAAPEPSKAVAQNDRRPERLLRREPARRPGLARASSREDEEEEAEDEDELPASPPDAAPAPVIATPVPAPVTPPAPPAPAPRVSAPPAPPKARIGSMDASPAIGAANVDGALQSSVVRRGVERALGGYRDCYRAAARSAQKTPSGSVKLTFEIDESGMVRRVQANGAPLPGMGACMQDATSRIRSRIAPDVGVARASVVVTFAPTEP
jgi:hypothetical protein